MWAHLSPRSFELGTWCSGISSLIARPGLHRGLNTRSETGRGFLESDIGTLDELPGLLYGAFEISFPLEVEYRIVLVLHVVEAVAARQRFIPLPAAGKKAVEGLQSFG